MPIVLLSAPYLVPILGRFQPVFDHYNLELIVISKIQERLEEQDLLAIAGQFDGVICGDDRFSARVLDAMRSAPESDFQMGNRHRFYRSPCCRPAGNSSTQHPQCIYFTCLRLCFRLYPGICPAATLDRPGYEKRSLG